MNCNYCSNQAEWVENKEIYGRNYGKSIMVWLCRKCNAYVGCHNNTRKPLGTMANKELREWRIKVHALFDPLWKTGKMRREKAYGILRSYFGYEVHIGESDIEMCKKIVKFLESPQFNHKEGNV